MTKSILVLLCLLLTISWCAQFRHHRKEKETIKKAFNTNEFHEYKRQKSLSQKLDSEENLNIKDAETCDTEPIRVHLIPHSHDDVGWLKTVDEYYWGNKDYIQRAGVQYIYDGVTKILEQDPTKKFVVVEVAFFQRWWRQQTEEKHKKFHKLIKNGQIEFLGGGYCMNDEASAYYEDMIDQMTIGHQFLLDTFNIRPTAGWQIDPFGHSNTQASLFAQMGMDSMFFSRIDYQDMQVRRDNQGMETLWIPRTSQGAQNGILAHVNYYGYDAPPTFCFDIVCDDAPIMDDPRLQGYNLETRVDDLVRYFRQQCLHYRSNTLMHNIGSDFQFRIPEQNFKNWDKLVNYINSHPEYDMELRYSTPSEYINELHDEEIEFPVKHDDFFPYADNTNAYWTGYFTSRVALKGYIRQVGRFSQTFKKIVGLKFLKGANSRGFDKAFEAVRTLDEAMGINQHHDAVAGTAKQHVTDDYVRILHCAEQFAVNTTSDIYNELLGTNLTYTACRTNLTAPCNLTRDALEKHGKVIVTVVNPAQTQTTVVRMKVPNKALRVTSPDGKTTFDSEVFCSAHDNCDLFFKDEFQSLALQTYVISTASYTGNRGKLRAQPEEQQQQQQQSNTVNLLQNERTIQLDSLNKLTVKKTGHEFVLEKCTAEGQKTCQKFEWSIGYRYYTSFAREAHEQNSGAYIFRPDSDTLDRSRPYSYILSSKLYDGKLVKQINIRWNNMETTLRFYPTNPTHLEVETFVESIEVTDKIGKELTLNIATNLDNSNTFFTDSNGLEMQKRVKDFRETWDLEVNQPAAGNYYPVNSAIYLEDLVRDQRVTVLVDRSEGAAVLQNGEIELMIHRRLLFDDDRGVVEPLNETEPDGTGLRQRVTHYIVFDRASEDAGKTQRTVQYLVDQPLLVLSADPLLEKDIGSIPSRFELPNPDDLPDRVKLFIQPLNQDRYLVRLQNLDDAETISVSLPGVLKDFASIDETTLTGNQNKHQMLSRKFAWNNIGFDVDKKEVSLDGSFTLRPLEIRTFLLSKGTTTTSSDVPDRRTKKSKGKPHKKIRGRK